MGKEHQNQRLVFGRVPEKEALWRVREARKKAARKSPYREPLESGSLPSLFGVVDLSPKPLAKKPLWLGGMIKREKQEKAEVKKAALGIKQPNIFPEEKPPLCFDHNQPMKSWRITRGGKPKIIWYCPDCPRD